MRFHILTLFPEMVMQGLENSITGRAIRENRIQIEAVNIRDFSKDKHRRVDDYTYGGGAGMLMQPQPVFDAWADVCRRREEPEGMPAAGRRIRTIYVTPQGKPFCQQMAKDFASEEELVILCGHYEGIDERVLEEVVTDYVSIGDYVLTGGELAAMVLVDAIARLVPGVLHNEESSETESFHGGLLEYPQYSRPQVWHGKEVPKVLTSGNQKNIRTWRLEQSEKRTKERRPDLYAAYEKLQDCKALMMKQKLLHIDMIELINRGRAILLFREDTEILLQDQVTGICFHTKMDGPRSSDFLKRPSQEFTASFGSIVFHQKDMAEQMTEQLNMRITCACNQAVLTRREKLPVTGLYRPDGRPMEQGSTQGMVIRLLTMEHLDLAVRYYHLIEDPSYMEERIRKKQMYGAFFGDTLAGFIGWHEEGSIGMLEVFPEYRNRHIGMALETYLMNQALEQGMIPYGQIIVGNDVSTAMQQRLGLCISKERIYWSEREKNT